MAVRVTPGRIPVPAAAAYELAPLTAAEQPFLPGLGGVVAGILEWDPASGGQASVPVPIEWSQVSTACTCPASPRIMHRQWLGPAREDVNHICNSIHLASEVHASL